MPTHEYLNAKAEAERTHAVCVDWTKAFGLGVWREGHPADRQKLSDRRIARRVLAIEQSRLLATPEGSA